MAQSVEEIAVLRSSNWHRRRDATACKIGWCALIGIFTVVYFYRFLSWSKFHGSKHARYPIPESPKKLLYISSLKQVFHNSSVHFYWSPTFDLYSHNLVTVNSFPVCCFVFIVQYSPLKQLTVL